MVDTTACPIETPLIDEGSYYYFKTKGHALKYEIVVSVEPSRILWVNGPFRASIHDLSRNFLLQNINSHELFIADKAYVGERNFITPFKQAHSIEQIEWNKMHHELQRRVEWINRRVKIFRCLKEKWRHDLSKHQQVFSLVCQITNLVLLTVEPKK